MEFSKCTQKHFLNAYILALSKRKKKQKKKNVYTSAQKNQYDLNCSMCNFVFEQCVQCAIKQERKMALLDLDLVS